MNYAVRVRPEGRMWWGGALWLLLLLVSCTPQVLRPPQTGAPTSASEMAEDVERLDRLAVAGQLQTGELRKGRDRAREYVAQLKARPTRDQALAELALARAELTLSLYEDLLVLSEKPSNTRGERASVAEEIYTRYREYLRKLLELEQGVELLPSMPALVGEGGSDVEVGALPPPSSERLLDAYRNGQYDLVVKEVEGYGTEGLENLDAGVLVAYSLSLGAQEQYERALEALAHVTAQTLLTPEMSEVHYRRALWLLKEGKNDEAAKSLRDLNLALRSVAGEISQLTASTNAVGDDIKRGTAQYLTKSVDIRLAIADQRFVEARNRCTQALAQETNLDTLDRIEALLQQIDVEEERVFEEKLATIGEQGRTSKGRSAALAALEALAQQFPGPKFLPKIEAMSRRLGGDGSIGQQMSVETVSGTSGVSPGENGETGTSGETGVSGAQGGPGVSGAQSENGKNGAPIDAGEGTTSPGGMSAEKTGGTEATGATGAAGGADAGGTAGNAGATGTAGGADSAGAVRVAEANGGTQSATDITAPTPVPEDVAKWASALEQGKALSTSGQYPEAIALFATLKDTPLEAEAAELRMKAIDRYVQQVRERVAREFVRASQIQNLEQKQAILKEIYESLKGTIDTYPETTLRAKAEHNLKVIERELTKLDPAYFEKGNGADGGEKPDKTSETP